MVLLFVPLCIYLGLESAHGNLRLALFLFAAVTLFFLLFLFPKYLWAIAIASLFIPGSIPGLPLPFSPTQLIIMIMLFKYLIEQVIFGKRGFYLGPAPDWLLLTGLLLVLLYHGVQDRFAMRIFGSDIWGGKAYLNIILAILSYFLFFSSRYKEDTLSLLPGLAVVFSGFDVFLKVLTILVPGVAPYLYFFYSDVSTSGLDGEAAIFSTRWGFLGNFGYLLILWSITNCRIQEFFTKCRWVKASALCLGLLFCILGGYRSSVAVGAVLVACAGFRDFGWRGIFSLLPLTFMLALAILLQTFVGLPRQVQRSMAFLPGDWDQAVVADTKGSNDFRIGVWDVWLHQYFPQNAFWGRGFGLKPYEIMAVLPYTTNSGEFAEYSRDEAFVVSGNLHNGFYSIIDRFGVVGLIFFLSWTFFVLKRLFQYLRKSREGPLDPSLQWLAIYIMTFTLCYLPGALRFENFLPAHLMLVAAFFAIYKQRKTSAETAETVCPEPADKAPVLARGHRSDPVTL